MGVVAISISEFMGLLSRFCESWGVGAQAAIARESGISRSHVNQIANGNMVPRQPTIQKIMEAMERLGGKPAVTSVGQSSRTLASLSDSDLMDLAIKIAEKGRVELATEIQMLREKVAKAKNLADDLESNEAEITELFKEIQERLED